MQQNQNTDNLSSNRVFVGGISWKADEASLANFFQNLGYGKVIDCKIIMDKVTGKSKGYGFVTFDTPEAASKVKQSTNLYFLGKMMNVGDAVRKVETRGPHYYSQPFPEFPQFYFPNPITFQPGQYYNPTMLPGYPQLYPYDQTMIPPGWQPIIPGVYPQNLDTQAQMNTNYQENIPSNSYLAVMQRGLQEQPNGQSINESKS